MDFMTFIGSKNFSKSIRLRGLGTIETRKGKPARNGIAL